MRHVYSFVAAAFALALIAPVGALAFSSTTGMTVGNFQFVAENRSTRTLFFETYRATLSNPGAAASNVTATVSTTAPGITIVPGQNVLQFSPVPANSQVLSSNTFTILIDRTQAFSFSSLQFTFDNPVANAGPDQTATQNSTVTLNGSASTNPSGQGTLTYLWSFASKPAGSNATISNPTAIMPTFVVDQAGNYSVTLTVSNGLGSSSDSVSISTTNSPPVANAGPNQSVAVGSTVSLNGSSSHDVDGAPLSFSWQLVSAPTGSSAFLSNYQTATPSFVADMPGTYVAQLVVSADGLTSIPSTVTITTSNTPPVAQAGPNQVVSVGTSVQLDGSGSTDVNSNPLTYQWSFVAYPLGSSAVINNPTAVKPVFVADVAGTYVVQLIVNDGTVNSAPSTVVITTNTPLPPTANAGPNQSVAVGSLVHLSGSGTDPQNLPLTYAWSLIKFPTGSAATLSSSTIANPTFSADLPGTYIAQLIVTDTSGLSSTPATVTINTTGTAPVANPGSNQNVLVGATVHLNGSASTDSNGNPLTYFWSFTTVPGGSAASLLNSTSVSPSFVADLAGVYVVQLIVNDGASNSAPKTVTITAANPNITLSPNPVNLTNSPVVVTITLNTPAGGNGLTINLSGFDSNVISVPSSVTVPSNGSTTTFTVIPKATGSTNILASAAGYQAGQTVVNVSASGITLSLSSPGVGVGRSVTGTVTLSSPAPAGGTVVALSSNPSNLVTFNPTSVTIAQGGTTGTFSATGAALGSATLTASATGYSSGTATLLVANLGAISVQKNLTVAPGQTSPISVTLSSAAPVGGVTVMLVSSDPTKATVTSSITIPAGATVPQTSAQVTGVNFGSTNITASATSFTSDTESVTVAATLSFSPNTLSLVAGTNGNLTLNLSTASPSPLAVTVLSSNTGVATITPTTFTIAANATSVTIPISAVGPGTSTITASATGFTNATAALTVTAGGSITLPAGVSLAIGQSVSFPITLSTPAPASGITVSLISSDPTKVSISPASVNIVAGATSPATQPQVTGVNFGSANITATASGYTSASQNVKVSGSLSLTPPTLSVSAGTPQNLTLTLSTAAPAGGVTVTVASSNTAVATVPSSVVIAGGTTSIAVPVTGVSGGTSTITASAPNLTSATAAITVTSGPDIIIPATLTLSPGNSPAYNITLAKAPANAVTVNLAISDTSKVTLSTTSVSFNAGSTTPTRSVTINAIAPGTATITATATGLASAQTQVTVGQTATLTPTTLTINGITGNGTLTVTLSSAASSAFNFTLTSSNTSVATVPPSLPFSLGTQTVSFKVTAVGVGSTTVTASAPGYASVSSTVTVVPAGAIGLSLGSNSIQLQKSTTLTVTLPSAAPSGGETVTLAGNSNISISPTAVVIPQGSTTGTATITGADVGSASITATAPDFSAATPVTIQIGATIAWADKSLTISTLNTQVLEGLILSATVPQGATGIPITITSSNTSVATVQSPVNFFWDGSNMPTTKVAITSVAPGTTTLTASGTNIPPVTLTVTVTGPVTITTSALPNGSANTAYSFTVQASGGQSPYTWSATGLPSPLVINPTTGKISGTPTAASSGNVKITVTDSTTPTAQTASVTLPLTISAAVPTTLTAVSGTPQSAAINTAFAAPLQVLLKDANGNPLPGATITFSAPATGASGTFPSGATAITDATGKASVPFTANGTSGSYTVTASINALTATFSLTNTTGAAGSITATAGTPQSAKISTAFATLLQATVKDAGNNPVAGVTVTFNAPGSGASGTFANGTATTTAATNASGVATASAFTANSAAGSYSVTATVSGVATPAAFSLSNTAGSAASITATSGSGQSAKVGTAFSAPLVATVKDSGNNPVSGVTVTFTAPTTGASGSFAGGVNTATTNAAGVATSAVFTANSSTGSYSVTAAVSGVATPATFGLTNTAGAAGTITATSGTPQSVQVTNAFAAALVATVKDSNGNPVPNVVVTFTAPSSGPSGTFAGNVNTATTNASGVATAATFTANKIAGSYSVTASTPGVAAPATYSLTNTAGPAAAIAVTSGSGQSAKTGAAFASPLAATVTDANGNPVAGTTVTFTAPTSGATGTFAGGVNTATTNSAGLATSAIFTANGTPGSYSVTASAPGVATPASFSLTNSALTPTSVVVSSGSGQSAIINTAFAAPLQVLVKDASSNPVNNVVVTFTAPTSGASGTFPGSLTTVTATTNASGLATSPTFTANSTAGAYTVNATVSGVATPAAFSLTNNPGTASSITVVSGSPQSAQINTTFAKTLSVIVKDAGGNPINGATVTFTPPASGASGTFAGGVNTARTDATGTAVSTAFTANATLGSYTVVATVNGVSGISASFSLSNTVGQPNSLTVVSGTPQTAAINTAFSAPFVVVVKDAGNNPVSGATVTFVAPTTGASGTFAGNVNTAVTDATGTAKSATFTANGTQGSYTVTATLNSLSASFALTNSAGAPSSITVSAGNGQGTTITTAFPTALAVLVKDAGNNPISGKTVTFTVVPANGATANFAGSGTATAVTNASGIATAPTLTAGSVAGNFNVTATLGSLSTSFTLTDQPGPAATITIVSGNPQTASTNTAFANPLQVRVTDVGGNPVRSASVVFTAPSSGASATFAGGSTTQTVATDSTGLATSSTLTANGTSGSYAVSAAVQGVTGVNFTLTNTGGPAGGTISVTNATIGQNLQAPITITLNPPAPAAGVAVTITSQNPTLALPGASGQASETVTEASGTTVFSISIEALASTGTATIAITAPGYNAVNATITLAKSAFVIAGPNGIGTGFSPYQGTSTPLTIEAGYLDQNGNFAGNEQVRLATGYSVTVPLSSSNTAVGTLQDCSVSPCKSNITSVKFSGAQATYSGINFVASSTAAPGSTATVTATAPSGFSTPASGNTITATIQQASAVPFNVTVGQNLQAQVNFLLNAQAPAGGVQYTLQSSDPTKVVFSTDPTVAGTGTLNITIPGGHAQQNGNIWVQVFGNSGAVTYTATTSGQSPVTGTVTLAPSGIIITSPAGVGASTFTLPLSSGAATLGFSTYLLNGSGNAIDQQPPVPGVLPLTINLTNSTPATGSLSPTSLTITAANVASNAYSPTATFTPASAGQSTITASATGFATASVSANVSNNPPHILIGGNGQNDPVIGNGLESLYGITFPAAPAGGIAITVGNTSGNVLLSPDGIVAGKSTITINVPANATSATFYVQGAQNSGGDTVNISAPGYVATSASVTLSNAGFVIAPSSASVSLQSGSSVTLTVYTELLDPSGVPSGTDEGPVATTSVTLNNSNPSVATAPSSISFPLSAGPTGVNVTVTPKSTGSTTISLATPAGYTMASSNTSTVVTVNP